MRHDRRIAFLCDMSHKRFNESDDTGLKGKTKERRSPGCSQTHGLAQAESAISTEGRRCPRETLFSHHVRLVAELGRRPSIPSPKHGRDSGKISKRPSDGTAPEMSQPTSIAYKCSTPRSGRNSVSRKSLNPRPFTARSPRSFHGWLLARSEYPEMEAIKLFAKVRVYVAQPERFL
jgi:hypothetical protein